jgi:hypothetical protein
MAGGEPQEVGPQVLEGGEVVSLGAELSQPELEHCWLGHSLDLVLGWLVEKSFRGVGEGVLQIQLSDFPEPGFRREAGGWEDGSGLVSQARCCLLLSTCKVDHTGRTFSGAYWQLEGDIQPTSKQQELELLGGVSL